MLKRFKRWWQQTPLQSMTLQWWSGDQLITMRPSIANDLVAFEVIEQQLYATPPWGRQGFRAYFQGRHHQWFTITTNKIIIGYVGVSVNAYQQDMHLTNIGIIPSYQGLGIGTWCLQQLQQIARQAGLLTMSLEVK